MTLLQSAARRLDRVAGAIVSAVLIGTAGIVATLAPFEAALAQEQKPVGNTVRPEVGKLVQTALDLLKGRHTKDALARIHDADALPNKTAYETYLIARVHGQIAAAAGDTKGAAHLLETTAASNFASGGEKLQFLAAAAGQYYMAKDYAKVADLGARYFKDGGKEKSIRTLYIQALYLGGNFAVAVKELSGEIQDDERAGRAPPEDQLQMLANVYARQRDDSGYATVLEKLVAYHPKKDYWAAVIQSVGARPGFSERLALDYARLKLATGTMRTATEYVEAAQLSIQVGLPVEGKKIIDQGYAAGLLGAGPESDRHRRLKDMAARNLAEDLKSLGQDDAQLAASKDGVALVSAGLNHVLNGNAAKGLEMMEQGLRKGGMKHADDLRLHLGYAYHVAGQNQKAIHAFKAVQGANGAASLARLWVIYLGQRS